MDYLPIFMDLRGRNGLVVGGGDAAARKASLMLSAGAWVTAISPENLSDAFPNQASRESGMDVGRSLSRRSRSQRTLLLRR